MKMMVRLASCLLALASLDLLAQDSHSFDGTWRFTLRPPLSRLPRTGEVVLNGTSGTWKMFARTNVDMFENPCVGHTFSLTVLPSEEGAALTFQVHESDTYPGCSNVKVTLHALSANTLEGTTGLGYPVTMERQ